MNSITKEYSLVKFTTNSGKLNNKLVPEVHRVRKQSYPTVRWGWAHKTEVTIECQLTGSRDALGRDIYLSSSGIAFVFSYSPGCPEYFDSGLITKPLIMK